MADSISMKKLVTRLLLVVVAMFVFGFALVPIYDVMCKAFGINGKTAGQYEGEQTVDTSRQVRVQFLSTNSADMSWDFYPKHDELTANPGAVNEMIFIAHNPTDQPDERPGRTEHRAQRGGGVLPQDRMLLLYPASAAARSTDRDAGTFHR